MQVAGGEADVLDVLRQDRSQELTGRGSSELGAGPERKRRFTRYSPLGSRSPDASGRFSSLIGVPPDYGRKRAPTFHVGYRVAKMERVSQVL